MSIPTCPRCHHILQRSRRRWYERLLLVRKAYRCNRCGRRRYRAHVLGFLL